MNFTLRNTHQLRVRRRWNTTLAVPAVRFVVEELDGDGHHVGIPFCSLNEHGARAWAESAVRRGYGLAEHALPEDSPAFREALAKADLAPDLQPDDGLRLMLVPDRGERFVREGRSLVTDPPVRIPEPVARQTSREMAKLARVRDVVRARREREARVVREAREGIRDLADWLGGEGGAAS